MQEILKKNQTKAIDEVDVQPGKQPHISLGKFKNAYQPKGFSIHLTPDPDDDAIATHVTSLQMDDETYELVLHIANYGNKTIHAEIWRM
mgnify:CR=1 FL=1